MGYKVEDAPIEKEEEWNNLVDSADAVRKEIEQVEGCGATKI